MHFINKKKIEGKFIITLPGVKITTSDEDSVVVKDTELEVIAGVDAGACQARFCVLASITADLKVFQSDGFATALPFGAEVFTFGSKSLYSEYLITRLKWQTCSTRYQDAMMIFEGIRRTTSCRDGQTMIIKADGKVEL